MIAGSQVVAGSQYLAAGRIEIEPGFPPGVGAFAESVLGQIGWRLDPIFMLDICQVDGQLFVLEIGPFSGCAFYACEPAKVVAQASELAASAVREPAN